MTDDTTPMGTTRAKASMRQLIWPAIGSSFAKLDPRDVAHNPVMFVVEVGSVITTHRLHRRASRPDTARRPSSAG